MRWLLVALLIGPLAADTPGNSAAPIYTAESIANTAANIAGYYAANTFLSIYGENLAFATRAIAPGDILNGLLPTALPGTSVRVLINLVPAHIYYVSPQQVNVLVPPSLGTGRATVQLIRDGVAGPAVAITLGAAAPALFPLGATTVIATHADGALVTESSPARRGETIVLYAGGLGPTVPAAVSGTLAQGAAQIANKNEFRVSLNGAAVESRRVAYAGLTPGFAGLFQINLQLPEDAPLNAEIRMGFPDLLSPAGRILLIR